jgi:hypothetical protein
MSDDLPDLYDGDPSSGDDDLSLLDWALIGAGGIVAVYLGWWLLRVLFGLLGWLVSTLISVGFAALAVYAVYLFVQWLMGGSKDASPAGQLEHEPAEETMLDPSLEDDLDDLEMADIESDLDRDLGGDRSDDELERKFEELERELQNRDS